jgi:transcription initiation factor TFIIIB Brf1 subunit/transcription initiation factor TFIIB
MSYDYKCPNCISYDINMDYHEDEGVEFQRQCNNCGCVFQVYEP